MDFKPMPKTPRLSREIVITEKIDGTNASVNIVDFMALPEWDFRDSFLRDPNIIAKIGDFAVRVGSRQRWITPQDDNFGFAAWVRDNADELVKLGPGHHFGEWWGKGIQRGYGLPDRRFSLFNVSRWLVSQTLDDGAVRPGGITAYVGPTCCDVVPVLYRGSFGTDPVESTLNRLREFGSHAAPGFMDPEGVMVYHTAAGQLFKKTLKGDEEGKHAEAHPKKERAPKAPRDPNVGGRRKANFGRIDGPERRKA